MQNIDISRNIKIVIAAVSRKENRIEDKVITSNIEIKNNKVEKNTQMKSKARRITTKLYTRTHL